ncbi:MAG: hypothetical protein MJZ38_05435 [archaeon]|nr:hypothetical protein [archaeon]
MYSRGEGMELRREARVRMRMARSREEALGAARMFERAAELGETASYHSLATAFLNNELLGIDPERAEHYYNKAVETGHLRSYFNLVRMFLKDDSPYRDEDKGLTYLERYIDLASVSEQESMFAFLFKIGLKEMSVEGFRRLTDEGHAHAWAILGHCYGTERDDPDALRRSMECYLEGKRLDDRASIANLAKIYAYHPELGHEEESYDLACRAYAMGDRHVTKLLIDIIDANEWMEVSDEQYNEYLFEAAEAGYGEMMYRIAERLINGDRIEKDVTRGVDYLWKGVFRHNFRCIRRLSAMYLNGRIVERDLDSVVKICSIGMKCGVFECFRMLGRLHERREIEGRGPEEAADIYRQGMRLSHDSFATSLIAVLMEKVKTPEAFAEALAVAEDLEARGNIYSYEYLLRIHRKARGVPRDLEKALTYAQKMIDVNLIAGYNYASLILEEMGDIEGRDRMIAIGTEAGESSCMVKHAMALAESDFDSNRDEVLDLLIRASRDGHSSSFAKLVCIACEHDLLDEIPMDDLLGSAVICDENFVHPLSEAVLAGKVTHIPEAFQSRLKGLLDPLGRNLYLLGTMYEMGVGVEQSDNNAAFCYLSAARKGCVEAFLRTFMIYNEGWVLPQDIDRAFYMLISCGTSKHPALRSVWCDMMWRYVDGDPVEIRSTPLSKNDRDDDSLFIKAMRNLCMEGRHYPDPYSALQLLKPLSESGYVRAHLPYAILCKALKNDDFELALERAIESGVADASRISRFSDDPDWEDYCTNVNKRFHVLTPPEITARWRYEPFIPCSEDEEATD